MMKIYHNHTLQTNSRHHQEELQNTNSHKTSGRQLKQNNKLPLPHQDDCKAKKDTIYCITKQGPNTEPPQTMGTTKNYESTTTTTTTTGPLP